MEEVDTLSILNLQRKTLPGPTTLHGLIDFSQNAKTAFEFCTASGEIERVSYQNLDLLTSRLAAKVTKLLGKQGIEKDNPIIPVFIPQCSELYISWIAVLKAGAAFCPIAIDTPPERLKFILEDVSADLVLTIVPFEKQLMGVAGDVSMLVVSLPELESSLGSFEENKMGEPNHLLQQDLAYIMYTSGSTGLPKGVKIGHIAVSQALLAHDEHLPQFKRFLQFASPTFDVSVFEIFFPLFRGATIVSRDRNLMLADLPGTIRDMNIDAAELTPTVASTLLKTREAAPCLEILLTIGEMLMNAVIREFGESPTRTGMLYAMYGPTEASIHCTLASKIAVSSSVHNVGLPLATVTAAIVQTELEQSSEQYKIVPRGGTGELAIAGQLATGYLNRPEQTAAAFIDIPNYGSFYRTGDRARIAADGTLEILGRLTSNQVKLRGQRVELGEIENIACRTNGVMMAAATIINDALVLFCVEDDVLTTKKSIRETCEKYLLRFMIPSDIVIFNLQDLPRLPSGKMDRKKMERDYVNTRNTAPSEDANLADELTANICKYVSEELGRSVSPTRSLWTEGLNSLMAIKISSSLRAHHIEVGVRDFLETETVADIVANLNSAHSAIEPAKYDRSPGIEDAEDWHSTIEIVKSTAEISIVQSEIEDILPCCAIQTAMLAETMVEKRLNFNTIDMRLSSKITADQVRAAFQQLAQTNEILRSGFVVVDQHSLQFALIVWRQLKLDKEISLLHPVQIERADSAGNILRVRIHHALYDGWSWDLIMKDLEHLLAGQPIPNRPQFRQVSLKQRSIQLCRLEAAKQYWGDLLAAATPSCLPQLRPNINPKPELQIEQQNLTITRSLLADFARKVHVSPQVILSAAICILLSSYTGSMTTILGYVSSGRHLPVIKIEEVIGPCLSTLPLKIDLSTVRTIQDLLRYVHRLQLDFLDHGVLSLREILAAAGASFQQKLFDSIFVWQERPSSSLEKFSLLEVDASKDELDYSMIIEAEPKDSKVELKLSYNTKNLTRPQVQYFLKQLDYLVAEMVANPKLELDGIWESCDPGMLAIANPVPRPSDVTFDLVSSIRRLSETSPDRSAISFIHDFEPEKGSVHVETLTYRETWQQSCQMARFLRDCGAGEDDRICVILEKSADLYVLNLAIVMAGCAFLNVDARTPSGRISEILNQVSCKILIRSDEIGVSTVIKTTELLDIPLATAKAQASQYSEENFYPSARFGGSTLAYVVMTSGTTGNPKAILVTRNNLLSNIKALSGKYPRYEGQNTLLQACSPAFDVYVFELFWTLHMGFCLCSASNDILFRDIEEFIRATNVTHLSLTPSVAALIQPENVPSVKFLVTAGEPMNSKVFAQWAGQGLFQGYGPAETTNISNVKGPIQPNDVPNNVGPPLENTSIFICAKQHNAIFRDSLKMLPVGAVGEIVIGGDQIARGYAEQSLIVKSFINTKYGRLYRSGDLGRLLANGDLVILGREDDQIKLRGQRIELGDINAAITKVPFVKNSTTIYIEQSTTMARLISFWTANSGPMSPDITTTLYELLESSLLPYLIPDALICLSDFPLTRQGKIDKRALEIYYSSLDDISLRSMSRGNRDADGCGSFSGQERLIAQALSEIVNSSIAEFSPTTSFYALGIDSISAVRFSQKLKKLNLKQTDVSSILRHCSIRRLSKAIDQHTNHGIESNSKNLVAEVFGGVWREKTTKLLMEQGYHVEKILPCTRLQDSILALQAHEHNSSIYETRLTFEVRYEVDILRVAWSDMVRRHQILRTGFVLTPSADYTYAQVILERFDLPSFAPGQSVSSSKTKEPTDFIYPPWRLEWQNISSGGWPSLMLIMSHALYDFEALALLLRDIELKCKSKHLKSVASPDAYFQYMLQLDLKKTDRFWQMLLKGYQPKCLFGRFQSSEGLMCRQQHYLRTSTLSQRQMRTAAQDYSVTPATLFQAAWGRLLSNYTNSGDVVFGTVLSGRNLPIEQVADIVAPLFNTLPLRIQLNDRQSMRELVTVTQTTALQIMPFQPSSLRRIIRDQKLGNYPLFDTLVLVQSGELCLDQDIWTLKIERGDMDFHGIVIEVLPDARSEKFILKLHVQCETVTSFVAFQILEHFETLVDQMIHFPQAQAHDFGSVQCSLPMLQNETTSRSKSTSSWTSTDLKEVGYIPTLYTDIISIFSRFSGVNIAKITPHTSIFEIGLDSLHVIQIASDLREKGYYITGADVLEGKTVAKLSNICLSKTNPDVLRKNQGFNLDAFDEKHRQPIGVQLNMVDSNIQSLWPCTPTQSGILTEFINSKGGLYFNCVTMELSEDVNVHRLRRAWRRVMDRNDILRTGFVILGTSAHAYGMVIHARGSQMLPWLTHEEYGMGFRGSLALSCLENLHEPCWRLLLKQNSGRTHLEFHALHSLYDAVSFDHMLEEVSSYYRDEELQLPDPEPVGPGVSTILGEFENLSGASAEFWRHMGAGASSSRFPDLNTHHGVEEKSIVYSEKFPDLLSKLREGCQRLDVSLQSVCQVAWAQLLAAYTGESKVMFGVILSGRNVPELAGISFPTIRTLPFAIQVGENMKSMLSESTALNIGLYTNQLSPYSAIRKVLDNGERLFDTVIVLHSSQSNAPTIRPWKIVEDRATAEYSISMEIFQGPTDDIELRITSLSSVVPPEHAKLLVKQYEILLRQVVQDDLGVFIAEQSLLSKVEAKDEIIETEIKLLHEFVESTARKTPESIALEFVYSLKDGLIGKHCWSYKQLDEESNMIAHLLIATGIEPGDFVAVCFDKCPEASFAILAVLKAGCTYVAIDPSAPIHRKMFILGDAHCKALLTTKNLGFSLGDSDRVKVLTVDDPDMLQNLPKSVPILKRKVSSSDICYCLYTSGTTGQPKGCLISHSSVVQAMLSFQRIFAGHWDENSRWLQFASFHFDVSVLEQYWSWSVGICVTSAPRDLLFEDIVGTVEKLKITHLDLTPSLARLLTPEEVPNLCKGVFIVGGEQVTQDIIETWGDAGCLYNFYGPSEVTIGCTVHKRVRRHVKATNIGQAWDNVGAFVLEPGTEKVVLRGCIGELCLSGPLVGRGYLNRPDLSAAKFVHLKDLDKRIYRSGDLVRLLHDNSFEFLGRIDDQIKLRGQRLELREIDYAIKHANESIVDVVTIIAKHTDQGNEQLAAFFTIRGQIFKSSKVEVVKSGSVTKVVLQIRQHLQKILPGYMVPAHIVPITSIPLSANNKTDLKRLHEFFANMPIRSLQNMDWNGMKIPPLTNSARKIVRIVSAFFGVPESMIGPSSSLFELGLDSISAVALANMLRKSGFIAADGAKVMRNPVLAELADDMDASKGDDYQQAVETAERNIENFRQKYATAISSFSDFESLWPCTPLQQDMLSKAINRAEIPFYLSSFHFRLRDFKDLDIISNAWQQAQRTFSILRTVFVEVSDSKYAALVLRECQAPIYFHKATSEEDPVEILNQKAAEWHERLNILGQTPCWEVEILKTSKGLIYMSLRIFHGLYDGNSLLILLDEVTRLINIHRLEPVGEIIPFHNALQYGPLCRRDGAKYFWKKHFSGAVLLELPQNTNILEESARMERVESFLPEKFNVRRKELGVTASAIFQAAFLLSLHAKYRVVPTLGLVVSGRSFPLAGVEKICGPLFNTIPFQISPMSNWSRVELIRACHDLNINCKPHEHTPVAKIREWVGLETHRSLFETIFVFQQEQKATSSQSNEIWELVGQSANAEYPLNLEVLLKEGAFVTTIVADPEFLSSEDVSSLCLDFQNTMKQLIEDPHQQAFPDGFTSSANEDGLLIQTAQSIDVSILQEVKSQVAQAVQYNTITIDDDTKVVSLGFDSISLIKLSTSLKRKGFHITVNMLMRLSTPAQIAGYLTQKHERSTILRSNADAARNIPNDAVFRSNNITGPVFERNSNLLENFTAKVGRTLRDQKFNINYKQVWPVTPLQEAILGNYDIYYHFAIFKLAQSTEADRLYNACVSVAEKNPVWRISFVEIEDPEIEDVFAQLVTEINHHIFCSRITLETEGDISIHISACGRKVSQQGIRYPPFRADLIKISNTGDRFLVFGMSHAIYDGWSIQLLHQDISRNYDDQQVQRPAVEPYLEQTLNHPDDGASKFWKNQIMDHALQVFPALAIDPQQPTPPPSHRLSIVSRTDLKTLEQFCMTQAVTIHTFGLAVWTCVLASYIESNDVCFGVVLACRDTEEMEQLMFPTFNTVPFKLRLQGGKYTDLLMEIQRLCLDISEHQKFPLRTIKKLCGIYDDLFDTVFVMQRRLSSVEAFSKLYEEVDFGPVATLHYPVNVEMEISQALTWTVAVKSTVLDEAGVRDLIEKLEMVTEEILRPGNYLRRSTGKVELEANLSSDSNAQTPSRKPLIHSTPSFAETRHTPVSVDSEIQAKIFGTVASVLQMPVEELSDESELYRLGLDSISIIKVATRLRRLNISLSSGKMLQAGTLGRAIVEASWVEQEPEKEEIAPHFTKPAKWECTNQLIMHLSNMGFDTTAIEMVVPATAGQILMLDYYVASESRLFYYNFQYEIKHKQLSENNILEAWHEVVNAIPILRTKFLEFREVIWQVVIDNNFTNAYSSAAMVNVSAMSNLFRLTLLIHHALYDAVSLPMIITLWEKAIEKRNGDTETLRTEKNGHSVSFDNAKVFKSYQPQVSPSEQDQNMKTDEIRKKNHGKTLDTFLRQTRKPSSLEAQQKFWVNYVSTFLHEKTVVKTVPPAARRTFSAPRLAVMKSGLAGSVTMLKSVAAGRGLSLQTLFLAAAGRAYAKSTNSNSEAVLIGVYLSNRGLDISDLDIYPGLILNILPLLVYTGGSLEDSAKKAQDDLSVIRQTEYCELTLRDFYRWTSVTIDCFVNWVPALDANEIEGTASEFKLIPVDHGDDPDLGHVNTPSPFLYDDSYERPSYCVPTLDIEVTADIEGALALGVFSPRDMFGEEDEAVVQRIVDDIFDTLDDFTRRTV